jgi:lysophospholipase L1-like esterase
MMDGHPLGLTAVALLLAAGAMGQEGARSLRAARLLAEGEQTVRIVCFGDSITGVYYHTGGRRAWPEMLGLALQRLYPAAQVEVVNAGLSGDTTVGALARLEADVLRHRPHVVVVMFGMNDVTRVPPETYHGNLTQIVQRCRGQAAEVVLCTPNSIYPEDGARPVERLAEYAEIVRAIGATQGVPVADCYGAYEAVRAADRRAWMGLMSETIHPNMRGHKVFAEEVAWVISGRRVWLHDVPPVSPCLTGTRERIDRGEVVKVVAMPPYDALVEAALRTVRPQARVEVTTWPVEGKSLAEIEREAQARGWPSLDSAPPEKRPDLVVIAVRAGARADSDEQFYRSYSWVLNWSLSFGRAEWDCVAILPSVAKPDLDHGERAAEGFAREVVEAQDIGWLARADGDVTPAGELLARWLKHELGL